MEHLRIINIQRGSVYDGPGIRTTVFLKGCMFHCPWCCNPESQSYQNELFFDENICLSKSSKTYPMCVDCEKCGGLRQISLCELGAVQKVGYDMTSMQLYETLIRDKSLYNNSHGGVTFSGGEPLLYQKELIDICRKIHESSVNTYIETSLALDCEIPFIEMIDGFIVDLKLQPEMGLINDKEYRAILNNNIQKIRSQNKKLVYRLVFIDSMYQIRDDIIKWLNAMNIHELEILKCHNLGEKKYKLLKKPFIDYSPNENIMIIFSNYLMSHKILNKITQI
jgi:pyruvate formate lyase activating enzyme